MLASKRHSQPATLHLRSTIRDETPLLPELLATKASIGFANPQKRNVSILIQRTPKSMQARDPSFMAESNRDRSRLSNNDDLEQHGHK